MIKKGKEAKTRKNQGSEVKNVFKKVSGLFCPKNGCVLLKYAVLRKMVHEFHGWYQ